MSDNKESVLIQLLESLLPRSIVLKVNLTLKFTILVIAIPMNDFISK